MSNTVTNLCRPLRLTPPQKSVLMALADRADDTGAAWPSISWLCEWTCFGRTAVITALKGLEVELHLITNYRSTGRNNKCVIHLDRIAEFHASPVQATKFAQDLECSVEQENPADQSATRTSPPDEPVRQTNYHQSATRTTTSPPGVPTSPSGAPDTSINISKTSSKQREGRASGLAITELPGVSDQLMADYLAARKAKKGGVLTSTALAGIEREAKKAGLTLAEALTECCEAGWQGFRADWYFRRHGVPQSAGAASPGGSLPDCPFDELLTAYAEALPSLPQPRRSLFVEGENAVAMRQRWAWVLTAEHESGERKGGRLATTAEEGRAWFARYFEYVADSDFLCGRDGKFQACDLGWLVTAANFEKVLSGKYHGERRETAYA